MSTTNLEFWIFHFFHKKHSEAWKNNSWKKYRFRIQDWLLTCDEPVTSKVCIIRLDHICFEKSSSTFWQVRCCAHRTRRSCQKYDEDFFKFCGLLRKPKLYKSLGNETLFFVVVLVKLFIEYLELKCSG